jgi:hypothetical protein
MLFFQIISRTGFDDQSSRNNFPTREDCLLRRVFKMAFQAVFLCWISMQIQVRSLEGCVGLFSLYFYYSYKVVSS